MHCVECGQHSVFRAHRSSEIFWQNVQNEIVLKRLECSRDHMHQAMFLFRVHGDTVTKIGQWPSSADIDLPDFKKYLPVLGKIRHRELVRGLGLASNGVGAGAFVYLRRVFEGLIGEAADVARKKTGWDEPTYIGARMEERIKLPADYLPEFIVQNRCLYGIMSIGVHTLTDEQCLEALPTVQLAIELILDEALERHLKQAKIDQANKSISQLQAAARAVGAD